MYSPVDTAWVLWGAALVFFMQCGFAMLETGFTRAKNSGNIIMKNLMDFSLGAPLFWLVGFGLMFGGGGVLLGRLGGPASEAAYGAAMLPAGIPFWAFLVFQTVFAGAAATIVSGAMAERTKFIAYCISSAGLTMLIYPVSGHWIWGGGWLAGLGFHDFAGGAVVHLVGGAAALAGVIVVGPRVGKFSRQGKPRPIPGHNIPLAALGVFILWFCWYGFNGASTFALSGEAMARAGKIFANTTIAPALAAATAMILSWLIYGRSDVPLSLNGALAGLVAITAGCDTVAPAAAALIGLLAGGAVIGAIHVMEKVLHLDDPVGAVSVHGGGGILGLLAIGFFSDGSGTNTPGLFYGGGPALLGVQALGAVSVALFVTTAGLIMFGVLKRTTGVRLSVEEEIDGLDLHEHNIHSYSDFLSTEGVSAPKANIPKIAAANLDKPLAREEPGGVTLSSVVVVMRQSKLDELLLALNKIGVTGVTVSQVTGYGIQKGNAYYRGAEVGIQLLPKVKLEIVVSTVPVALLVDTVEKVLYTGRFGDGKIFIYDVREVIKVRTGETGVAALTDAEIEGERP
ncbi:MAG: ammonium transporter [Gracilibacteraceae bacterium]|jgi:Amt family ammonium transporter|nr:ammonium transporter [Gracilibacteraceae bacterium]